MQSNNYQHITANGTYVLAADQCNLEMIKVNFADAGGTITITEGVQSQVIADKIDNTKVYKHDYDITNLNGLRVIVANATAPDITVVWQ